MNRRLKIILLCLGAAVVLAVAAVAAYLLTRDDAPEAVDLATAVARIESATDTEGGSDDEPPETTASDDDEPAETTAGDGDEPAAASGKDMGTTSSDSMDGTATSNTTVAADAATDAGAGAAPGEHTEDAVGGLDGVWTVQVAENAGDLQGEPAVSFAGFRVDEVLAGGIGDFTAVGRTADVSGSIELSGSVLVAATVEVTMSTLRTDNSSRDSQARRALNTNEFPVATFTLAGPVELPTGMAEGEAFSGSAHGDLTIKGITNRATFDLQAQLVGDTIVAVGSGDVVFSDYGVTAPTAPIVVSVEDEGIMEFQLLFTR